MSLGQEPGVEGMEASRRAQSLEREVLRRRELPDILFQGEGDYGQRVRPGEERERGIAARADIRAHAEWILLESGRETRRRAVELRREGATESAAAYDLAFRGMVAEAYVESSFALKRKRRMEESLESFYELAERIQLRIDEGVERYGAGKQLIVRMSRLEDRYSAEKDNAFLARLRFQVLCGAPVEPMEIQSIREGDSERSGRNISGEESPSIRAMEIESEALATEAESLRSAEAWSVTAFGSSGPYFSGALDRRPRNEYFGGLRLTWTPDIRRLRSFESRAMRERSRALEAQASSESRALQRQLKESGEALRLLHLREPNTQRLRNQQRETVRIAQIRWQKGVGSWEALMDEMEKELDLWMEENKKREAALLKWIESVRHFETLEKLPRRIGQEST